MSDQSIEISYNENMAALASVLSSVKRPGDFYSAGSLETPMPKLEIEGVGVIAFPLQPSQAASIIKRSTKAPYGRGEATIVDSSIRNVWQLPPNQVRLSGKSWDETFARIMAQMAKELGCGNRHVSAELYKVLLYEVGSLFKPHRDTEKAEGMFGTLVITFPSEFTGGELIVRHAGRDVSLPMAVAEPSEVAFAAFYADCEHEVLPITSGFRLCLIFNLIHRNEGTEKRKLKPPERERETEKAADLLRTHFGDDAAPTKIAYLLEHQYTPATLSFAALKNGDVAQASVLCNAARKAGCAAYLAIVHIEERGSAEVPYESSSRRYGGYSREERSVDHSESYSVIDVSEREDFVSDWKSSDGSAADFGRIPLEEDELLPPGALTNEKPDTVRVSEATGNEGASFERSYHRAAIVLWPEDQEFNVLLQSGAEAAVVKLKKDAETAFAGSRSKTENSKLISLLAKHAEAVVEKWETESPYRYFQDRGNQPSRRGDMLELLAQIENRPMIQRFVETVVTERYDGSENRGLIAAVDAIGEAGATKLYSDLIERQAPQKLKECIDLLKLAAKRVESNPRLPIAIANAVARSLSRMKSASESMPYRYQRDPWARETSLADELFKLFDVCCELKATDAASSAADAIAADLDNFTPETIVVSALESLAKKRPAAVVEDASVKALWHHCATFLLKRSEFPPQPPKDWRRPIVCTCKCAHCRELTHFLAHPVLSEHRFAMPAHQRMHLESEIRNRSADLDCTTYTKASPHVLVCTKNQATFGRQLKQHATDITALRTLASIAPPQTAGFRDCLQRIHQAAERHPETIN